MRWSSDHRVFSECPFLSVLGEIPRYRGISWIALGLRVANWATEAPFRPLVSEAGKLRRSLFGGAGEQKAKVA